MIIIIMKIETHTQHVNGGHCPFEMRKNLPQTVNDKLVYRSLFKMTGH